MVDKVFSVDRFAVTAASGPGIMPGGVEQSVSLLGGMPLVEQVMGECRVRFTKDVGEGPCLGSLRAVGAIGMERVSDDQDFDSVLANETRNRFEVGAQCRAMQGKERLCDKSQRVGDGETDTAVANVEREDAWGALHMQDKCTFRLVERRQSRIQALKCEA